MLNACTPHGVQGLDAVAGTLEEFWLSYNVITSTAGLEKCANLRVLYLSNNKIAGWGEVERLAPLSKLEELLLVGNPLYNDNSGDVAAYRLQVSRGAQRAADWNWALGWQVSLAVCLFLACLRANSCVQVIGKVTIIIFC